MSCLLPLIPRAIALNSIAMQAGSMIGPAAYGFLYASHRSVPYWTSVVILALATACVLAIGAMPPAA